MQKLIVFITLVLAISANPARSGEPIVIAPKHVRELAQKLSEKIAGDKDWLGSKTMAILNFELIPMKNDQKIDKSAAENLREDLSTEMCEVNGVKLVERGQMKTALSSARLDQSDIIDPATAKETGKMLSADYLLCGSISDRDLFVVINARIIDTQTGEIKYSASVDFNK